MTRRPKLALMIGASLLTFPLAACDGGSTEPDGNEGEATPTAPPTADDDTDDDGTDDSENEDPGSTDPDEGDDDGEQGPDGSGG